MLLLLLLLLGRLSVLLLPLRLTILLRRLSLRRLTVLLLLLGRLTVLLLTLRGLAVLLLLLRGLTVLLLALRRAARVPRRRARGSGELTALRSGLRLTGRGTAGGGVSLGEMKTRSNIRLAL